MTIAKYLWLDLETTGLNAVGCKILEVAVIVTDPQFEEIARWRRVVKHDLSSLMMSQWPWKQHTESGLLDEIKDNGKEVIYEVDQKLAEFVSEHDSEGPLYLAGSSVHFDRRFMEQWLPETLQRLHYRQLDVSLFRVVAGDWWPELEFPKQEKAHRATQDIDNSLELARFFHNYLTG